MSEVEMELPGALEKAWDRLSESRSIKDMSGFLLVETPDGQKSIIIVAREGPSATYYRHAIESLLPLGASIPDYIEVIVPSTGIPQVPEEVKERVRRARVIHRLGYDEGIVDLCDDEFVAYLEEFRGWYADDNLPTVLNNLQVIDEEDYRRWASVIPPAYDPVIGLLDKKLRAFGLLRDRETIGGRMYQDCKRAVVSQLHGPQGHPAEKFMLMVGREKYQSFPPVRSW